MKHMRVFVPGDVFTLIEKSIMKSRAGVSGLLYVIGSFSLLFFFFQAEDGIRDTSVTGVQTCALPIFIVAHQDQLAISGLPDELPAADIDQLALQHAAVRGSHVRVGEVEIQDRALLGRRSEERRVGKECRCRWWPYREKKKNVGKQRRE